MWRRFVLVLLACVCALKGAAQNVEFANGQWFDGQTFLQLTAYSVKGTLTFRRPAQVDRVVDLENRYVVPPYGEGHTHSLSTPTELDKQIRQYLARGVFYVLVQDAIRELGPEILSKVNRPGSVDVSYTQGVVTPSWGMIPDFYLMLARDGRFGEHRTLPELDSRVLFIVDSHQDLERKFDQLAAKNKDFIKVILGFSEELDKRKNNPAYRMVPGQGSGKPGLDPRLLPALVQKAHARGLRVSAHVETAEDFRVAVRAGVDMIAHLPGWQIGPGTGFTGDGLEHWKISAADARLAAKKKVAVITTAAHDPTGPEYERFNEINRHNLRLLREAGAAIVLGSDGLEPADRREALYLAEVGGLEHLAILKMLTEATPQLIFPKRKIGALREGFEANFLLLEGNPLEDLSSLGRIRLRVKGGEELAAEEPIVVTTHHVGGNLYLLDGAVDLIGVSVGEDGLLLVDGGYVETLPAVREALDKFGKGKPKFLINTHWHHGFANEGFAKDTVLVSHRAARERLGRENRMFNRTVPARPSAGWPVVTFEDSMTLHFNGEEVRLLHFPNAHTDGDVVVFFPKSKVVMTGDIFVPHVPWTDRDSGGRVSALVAAVDRLLALVPPDAKIIPGHGRLCTYDDLKQFRVLLDEAIAQVRARVRAGRSLADIQGEGLPKKWRQWEGMIPVSEFLKAIYEEVQASHPSGIPPAGRPPAA